MKFLSDCMSAIS